MSLGPGLCRIPTAAEGRIVPHVMAALKTLAQMKETSHNVTSLLIGLGINISSWDQESWRAIATFVPEQRRHSLGNNDSKTIEAMGLLADALETLWKSRTWLVRAQRFIAVLESDKPIGDDAVKLQDTGAGGFWT